MKLRFRTTILNKVIYFFLTDVEKVVGIQSNVDSGIAEKSKHIPLFDFDDIKLNKLKKVLHELDKYWLTKPIYILSDRENSYRVICTDKVDWYKYIIYMSKLLRDGLDYQFMRWTLIRGYGTIRVTHKKSRNINKIVAVINYNEDNDLPIGKDLKTVMYEADTDQRSVTLKW